jgi:hypothetical protein
VGDDWSWRKPPGQRAPLSTHLHISIRSAITASFTSVFASTSFFTFFALVFGVFVHHLSLNLTLPCIAAPLSAVAFTADAYAGKEPLPDFLNDLVRVDLVLSTINLAAIVDNFLGARIRISAAAVYRVDF